MRPKRGRPQWKSNNNKRFNHNETHTSREYRHSEQLIETDVGITEFVSSMDGFSGVIKARYSDFQLNEIDLDGNVAKLTNTDIPKDFSLKMVQYNYKEVIGSPSKYIPQETWESIKNIVDDNNSEPVLLNAENIDKEARTEIHHSIKSHFGKKVIASTMENEGKKFIKFEKFRKEIVDARVQWPSDKGEYVYFIVYKEKMDTLEAMLKICSALKMGPSQFHHAGTKDRRAITSQWFSVKKVDPWKLIFKTKYLNNIKIGNIIFKDTSLKLGHLKGNKFRIAIRNVLVSEEIVNAAMNHLKEHNFINYYGLQRFGNDKEVPTYEIGMRLLKGKWKEAIDLILKPKSSDDPNSPLSDVVKAKKIYAESGNAEKAYQVLEKNREKSLEGKLLQGLRNSTDNDFVNALARLPIQMRLLYLHSFQSLIWNKMVSKRLQLFGKKPVVGDFVLINEYEEVLEIDESEGSSSKDEANKETKWKKQIKSLSEDDLNNYSIYDVVLPLPGYDINYPEHMKPHYKECIEEYGLDLEMTKQKVKAYNLSGDYRKMFGKVGDLTWKIVKYNNPTDNLILSDFQELKGGYETQTDENGKFKAVIMEFSLAACSYATMVLREIMKVDTSSNTHSKLNDYYEPNKEKKSLSNLNAATENTEEEENTSQTNSLLADPAKYESFKNSIFSAISEKRPICDDSGPAKRQKIEEEEEEEEEDDEDTK